MHVNKGLITDGTQATKRSHCHCPKLRKNQRWPQHLKVRTASWSHSLDLAHVPLLALILWSCMPVVKSLNLLGLSFSI